MSTTTCPVFYPTEEEFNHFSEYIKKIDQERRYAAICKVVPPISWKEKQVRKLDDLSSFGINQVMRPIKQVFTGRAGVYHTAIFEEKNMRVDEFYEYAKINQYNCNDYGERERKFWKSIGNSVGQEPPLYGADMPGTLFREHEGGEWNLRRLDTPLKHLPGDVQGVNTTYLYFGSWRAMFAFHCEDYNLYSINYLHLGEAKSWYGIPTNMHTRFENVCNAYFAEERKDCPEYIRHKTTVVSPGFLKQQGIEFDTALQLPGEFVITFPRGYHSGFNHGFNIAEATNFCSPRWFAEGYKARPCMCRPYSVKIDVEYLETMHLRGLLLSASKQEKKSSPMKLQIDNDKDNENSNDTNTIPKKKQRTSRNNVKTTDYVEVYEAYEAGDLSLLPQRIRCYCGEHCYNENRKDKYVEGDLCQCMHCGLYSHTKCVLQFYKYLNEHVGSIKIDGDLSSTCHICYDIDNVVKDDNAEEDGPSFKEILMKMTKKRKNKVEYKVGEEVILQSSTGVDIVYKIVSIEDGLSRIHQKGRPKEDDLWMHLDETICRKVNSNNNLEGATVTNAGGSSTSSIKAKSITSPHSVTTVSAVSASPANQSKISVPLPLPHLPPPQSNVHFARRVDYQQLKDCIYYFILHEINPRQASMKSVRQKIQQFFNMSRLERETYNADIGKIVEEFRYDYDQVTKTLNGILNIIINDNNNETVNK